MRVKIIDIDNKYRSKKARGKLWPNVAAAKTSEHHKKRGDTVGFEIENPDLTYIFCIFEKNRKFAIEEKNRVVGDVEIGGSGISLDYNLCYEIESSKPDYSLYPFQEFSMGFTSRGCFRIECSDYCIVRKKEGVLRRSQHIKEFHDFRFKSCVLLDNNILGIPDWFFENTNWAIENKVRLDITQGLDIRLLTDEISDQLKKVKFVDQQIKFAWDSIAIEEQVTTGISMLKDHGFNLHRNILFYVLCGRAGVPFCEDVYRCMKLRDLDVRAFAMPFRKTPLIAALARWSSRPEAYWSHPFFRYDRMPKGSVI